MDSKIDWSIEQSKDAMLEMMIQLVKDQNNSRHDWSLVVDNLSWYKIRKWLFVKDNVLYKRGFKNEELIIAPDHLNCQTSVLLLLSNQS